MAASDERIEGIRHFDIHVTDKNIDVSARTLISHIKKNWVIEKLRHKVFDDGISNKLIGFYVRPEHAKKDGFVNHQENRSDIVLVRIYGPKTELFIDRAKELRNFQLLQKNGISPKLYCTFENGYCYAFVEGRVLGQKDFADQAMAERSMKMLAKIHAVTIDQNYLHHHKMAPSLADSLHKFHRLLPGKFDDPQQQARFETKIPTLQVLKGEVEEICNKVISIAESSVAFCHNDALCANFIFDEKNGKLSIIDYEYGSINHSAYDIANHFNEFAGIDEVDYSLCPNKERQLALLRVYMEELGKLKWNNGPEITEELLEKFRCEVNRFTLASHLYWGLWAILQAHYSEIDFDFLGYSVIRLNEYFRCKQEILAS